MNTDAAGDGERLLPLAGPLPRLRNGPGRADSALEAVTVAAGAYRGAPEVATLGVANVLLCRPDLPEPIAAALTRVLVQPATRLVAATALGTQFLDVRSLISTGVVPLHPGPVARLPGTARPALDQVRQHRPVAGLPPQARC